MELDKAKKTGERSAKSSKKMEVADSQEERVMVEWGDEEIQSARETQPAITGFKDEGDHKPWSSSSLQNLRMISG